MVRVLPVDFMNVVAGQVTVRDSILIAERAAAPANPPVNTGYLYSRDNAGDTDLYWLDPAGVEHLLSPAGGPAPANAPYLTNGAVAGLSAEVDISAANALVVFAMGAVPATTGYIRLPNATNIGWRNVGNTANFVLGVDASDFLVFDPNWQVAFGSAIQIHSNATINWYDGAYPSVVTIMAHASPNGFELYALPASAGTPTVNPGRIRLEGQYWTGAISDVFTHDLKTNVTGNALGQFVITRRNNNVSTDILTIDETSLVRLIEATATLSLRTTPATTGAIRLPNAQGIYGRDFANAADLRIIESDVSDNVAVGPGANPLVVWSGNGIVLHGNQALWVYNEAYPTRTNLRAFHDGSAVGVYAYPSTAITTTRDSGSLQLGGTYWDGAASQQFTHYLLTDVTGNATATLKLQRRIDGAGLVTLLTVAETGLWSFPEATSTLAIGVTPATAGIIRLPNAESVAWRNAGNTADLSVGFDAENEFSISNGQIQLGDAAGDPGAVGELYRNSGLLKWHDGTNVLSISQQEAVISLFVDGALTVGAKKKNYNFDMPWAGTLLEARAKVDTAPTGAALIIDINEDGVTIFTATKLEVAIAATTGSQTGIQNAAFAKGAIITFDIDQIGSTIAGADLVIELRVIFTRVN